MESGQFVGGRFRILDRVGAGGMGIVFRAHDEAAEKTVAIKVFAWRDAVEVERAQREVALLAQLRHPAIVAHVDDGVTEDGELYLAMEWVDGVTVADRLTRTGFDIRESIAMTRAIAEALAVAHRAGVLHRDVKPSNVLLAGDRPSDAKLIDFGVARAVDEVKALTRTGTAIGTPGYMAPEQARGEKRLTPACDVFALGCVLYECLGGRPAFSGSLAAAVMTKILCAKPTPLSELCPDAPPQVVALVDRMLAKPRDARFRDCAAVLSALDDLGPLPASTRRNHQSLASQTSPIAVPQAHCVVGASRGAPDDMLEPPAAAVIERLQKLAGDLGVTLEVFVTGAVVGHLFGDPRPTANRAAQLALAMRDLLSDWSISISAVARDAGRAADAGAQLMTSAAFGAIFRKRGQAPAIVVDPQTTPLLQDEFVVVAGAEHHLVGRR